MDEFDQPKKCKFKFNCIFHQCEFRVREQPITEKQEITEKRELAAPLLNMVVMAQGQSRELQPRQYHKHGDSGHLASKTDI